jgi:hypothetical protein
VQGAVVKGHHVFVDARRGLEQWLVGIHEHQRARWMQTEASADLVLRPVEGLEQRELGIWRQARIEIKPALFSEVGQPKTRTHALAHESRFGRATA